MKRVCHNCIKSYLKYVNKNPPSDVTLQKQLTIKKLCTCINCNHMQDGIKKKKQVLEMNIKICIKIFEEGGINPSNYHKNMQ